MENLLSKKPLFLSEVKAGQKQGVELQGSRCWGSLGAELMECSSRRGDTLGGAHCWHRESRSSANTTFKPSQARRRLGQRRLKSRHIFLCFPKLPKLPVCLSLCVLVSYARECLVPFLATQVLFFAPSAEGAFFVPSAWPVFTCGVTPGVSP